MDKYIGETAGKYWKEKNDETYLKETELQTINDLNDAGEVDDDDLLVTGDSAGKMFKIKVATFLDSIKSKLLGDTSISSIGDGTVTGAISENSENISANSDDISDLKTALTNGSVTKVGTSTIGSAQRPMYLSSGSPTACSFRIQFGNVTGCSTANTGYADTNVTFSSTFSSTPYVIASFSNDTTSTNYPGLQITVTNRSTTGFTIRILSNYNSTATPSVSWIAIASS